MEVVPYAGMPLLTDTPVSHLVEKAAVLPLQLLVHQDACFRGTEVQSAFYLRVLVASHTK